MAIKLIVLAFIASLSLVQIRSCHDHERPDKGNEVREVFSINSNVELLFFFKKEASKAAKDDFFENVLNQPHPGGGYWPRDGVKAMFGIDRDGYEGFGFKFIEDASEQNKQDIKKLLSDSPLIHKVYENVVPNEIDDLKPLEGDVKR